MALSFRVLYRSNVYFQNITKLVKWNVKKNYPIRYICNGVRYQNNSIQRALNTKQDLTSIYSPLRCMTQNSSNAKPPPAPEDPEKKKSLINRFKQMYKDYWYVLLPVHMTTSAIWFGGFYYCVRRLVCIFEVLTYKHFILHHKNMFND